MASTPTPGLIEIWHVAFPVADLDRSIAFYCGRLGFDLVGRDDESAFVSLGQGGFTLEFLAPPAERPTDTRRAPDHVAFESSDLDAYRETLVQAGLSVPEIQVFHGGMKRFALADRTGCASTSFRAAPASRCSSPPRRRQGANSALPAQFMAWPPRLRAGFNGVVSGRANPPLGPAPSRSAPGRCGRGRTCARSRAIRRR